MSFFNFLRKIDWWLYLVVVALVVLGALSFVGVGTRSAFVIGRQFFFLGLGSILMLAIVLLDYRIFKNQSWPSLALYAVSIGLLLVALVSAHIRGISAWIIFFNTYQFQPSEFAKLAVLVVLAKYFAHKHEQIYNFRHIIISGVYVAIPATLTFLQPDFGSMAVFITLWASMLLFAGIKSKHLAFLFGAVTVSACLAWFFIFQPYQKDRIISFLNPYVDARGIGYNTIQSQTTLGSGGVLGAIGSRRDLAVLVPEPYTDFAFSAFGQRFGFMGILFIISLFLVFFWRIGIIASRASNNFAKFFALGYMMIVFVHFTINAGMNLGLLPITGIPLSFVSYGGSHLVTMMIGLGVIQSIRLHR